MTICGCEAETRRPRPWEVRELLGHIAKATGLPEAWSASLAGEQVEACVDLLAEIAELLADVDTVDCDYDRSPCQLDDGEPVLVGPLSAQDRANLADELAQAQRHAAWLGRPPLVEEIARPVLAAHGVEVGE